MPMSQIKTFKSYAKVNLGLKVLDLLPDNYHSIFTIMQEIDFYDIINIQKNNENKINLFCDGTVKVPDDKTNLCYKAAELIFNNYNISSGVNISLTKKVPIGAGLGGGSSNAATILCSLNQIFKLNISHEELSDLALLLGCDVPFFIQGGTQISEGKGEILTPININISQYYFLLVFPSFNVSTKWAYSFFKKICPIHLIVINFGPFKIVLIGSYLKMILKILLNQRIRKL